MTQPMQPTQPVSPVPQQPLDYSIPMPPGRPALVTVIAVLGIIWGGLMTLCSPLAIVPYFMTLPVPDPTLEAIKADEVLFAWTLFSTVVGWCFAILLLACSIGSLNLKEWARQGMLVWAGASIVLTVAGTIVNLLVLYPRIAAATASAANPGQQIGQWVGLGLGIVFGVVIPAAVLYVFTRPRTKAAFAGPQMPGGM